MSKAGAADADKPFLPRWALYLALPGFVGPVLVLAFVFITEYAHDEARCPYRRVTERPLSPAVTVREDVRQCLPGVQEHRYTAVHGKGNEEHVLGRRRFAASAFAPDHYGWDATLSADGEVHVIVHNAGHTDGFFREGTASERAQ